MLLTEGLMVGWWRVSLLYDILRKSVKCLRPKKEYTKVCVLQSSGSEEEME